MMPGHQHGLVLVHLWAQESGQIVGQQSRDDSNTMCAMTEKKTHVPRAASVRRGRVSLDNIPMALARDSAKAFPDGPSGRKRAIITLMAMSLDPELPDEVKRFLTSWGYNAEQYPTEIDPRGLYRQLLEAIEASKRC